MLAQQACCGPEQQLERAYLLETQRHRLVGIKRDQFLRTLAGQKRRADAQEDLGCSRLNVADGAYADPERRREDILLFRISPASSRASVASQQVPAGTGARLDGHRRLGNVRELVRRLLSGLERDAEEGRFTPPGPAGTAAL